MLEDLRNIPGIQGGFAYSQQKGIIASNLPKKFCEPVLFKLGAMLSTLYSTGRRGNLTVQEVFISFDEANYVVVESTREDTLLMLLCEPGDDVNGLVLMAVNEVMDELNAMVDRAPNRSDPPKQTKLDCLTEIEAVATATAKGAPAKNSSGDDALLFGPLADNLRGLEEALAKIVGPMAKIIFVDGLKVWMAQETPSLSVLSKLVDHLCREIEDHDKIAQFRERAYPFLVNGKA